MKRLPALKREARDIAREFGHHLGHFMLFSPHKHATTCKLCRLPAILNTNPNRYERQLSGRALMCPCNGEPLTYKFSDKTLEEL